ncbi:hypothetical protein [Streptomyces sp. NPDC000880]
MADAPRTLSASLSLMSRGSTLAVALTAVVATGDPAEIGPALKPLLGVGRVLDQRAQIAPYTALVSKDHEHPNVGQQSVLTTNGLLPATPAAARALVTAARGPSRSSSSCARWAARSTTCRPRPPLTGTGQQTLVIAGVFPPEDPATLSEAWSPVAQHTDGAYVNFESAPDDASFARAYPAATGSRVADLWRRYDPEGIFRRPERHLRMREVL